MNCTGERFGLLGRRPSRASRGVSFWHGPHHEAKKLRTTGRWAAWPRAWRLTGVPPVSDGSEKPGAWLPTPTTAPHPDPDPDEDPSPMKRKTASAEAITHPSKRARSLRAGRAEAVVGAAGDAGGAGSSAGAASGASVSAPDTDTVSAW